MFDREGGGKQEQGQGEKGADGRRGSYLSSSPPNCLVIRRRENMAPKISFASSSLDRALGFTTPGMSLVLILDPPDCRWAVLMDWEVGCWAQRLLYMHSALFDVRILVLVMERVDSLCLSKM
jgi:hypothetical protein